MKTTYGMGENIKKMMWLTSSSYTKYTNSSYNLILKTKISRRIYVSKEDI